MTTPTSNKFLSSNLNFFWCSGWNGSKGRFGCSISIRSVNPNTELQFHFSWLHQSFVLLAECREKNWSRRRSMCISWGPAEGALLTTLTGSCLALLLHLMPSSNRQQDRMELYLNEWEFGYKIDRENCLSTFARREHPVRVSFFIEHERSLGLIH